MVSVGEVHFYAVPEEGLSRDDCFDYNGIYLFEEIVDVEIFGCFRLGCVLESKQIFFEGAKRPL